MDLVPGTRVWGLGAGVLGVQLLTTTPWPVLPAGVAVGHVAGGLLLLAAAAATIPPVRRHLGGVEVLVLTMTGLIAAAGVVAGILLSRTTGLPDGYHPATWGWSTVAALALAIAVLLGHAVRLGVVQRHVDRLER